MCRALDVRNIDDGFEPKIHMDKKAIRARVSEIQYQLTRYPKIEQKHNGDMYKKFKKGTYNCAVCNEYLFNSEHKYKTDYGYPIFNTASENVYVVKHREKLGRDGTQERSYLRCANCGAYLGVVYFKDPLSETGFRYSLNTHCIKFHKINKKVSKIMS